MVININGKTLVLDKPTRVIDLIDENDKRKYYSCMINTKLKDLTYVVDSDSNIELFDLNNINGVSTYQSTLRYIIAYACTKVFKKAKISFNYSVSRSIFASVSGIGGAFKASDLEKIDKEVQKIIDADMPIQYTTISKAEALEYYKKIGYKDKVNILKYRKEDLVHVYKCGDYMNYLYNYLAPSTGYIKNYKLSLYNPGFIIQYPRIDSKGEIPSFDDEKVFRDVLRDANRWHTLSKCDTLADLNKLVEDGKALDFINMCEAKHNAQLTHLGDKIEANIDSIKLICVAGPSSSGKTTFTNRLRIELKSRGYEPLMISMDDFYKGHDYPKDEFGNDDYEHLEALDLDLFDKVVFDLINGETVKLPSYNFTTKEVTFERTAKLKENQPILIEGIHGLNPRIASSIGEEQKFKIFIAPVSQMRIDDHTPLSLTDLRLLRRLVRDFKTRDATIEKTVSMWSSVRKGEFRWIYPCQNNADFVFNSELTYEICVLKKHITPILEKVTKDSFCYNTSKRLLRFLKYINDINDTWVPCNSILREFIGDSIFYTKDKK